MELSLMIAVGGFVMECSWSGFGCQSSLVLRVCSSFFQAGNTHAAINAYSHAIRLDYKMPSYPWPRVQRIDAWRSNMATGRFYLLFRKAVASVVKIVKHNRWLIERHLIRKHYAVSHQIWIIRVVNCNTSTCADVTRGRFNETIAPY